MLFSCDKLYPKTKSSVNGLIPAWPDGDQSHYKTANIDIATITATIWLFNAQVYISSLSKIGLSLCGASCLFLFLS